MNFIFTKIGTTFLFVIILIAGFFTYSVLGDTTVGVSLKTSPSLERGLVGHWTFDGPDITGDDGVGIVDSSGQGNHGQLKGVATTSAVTPGRIGQGLKFDGVNDYVDLIDGTTLSSPFGIIDTFSISLIIKPKIVDQLQGIIDLQSSFSGGAARNAGILVEARANSNLAFRVGKSTTDTDTVTNSGELVVGETYFLTFTHDGTTSRIYKNGSEIKSRDITSGNLNWDGDDYNDDGNYVGSFKRAPGVENFFSGSIDDVRIYNRALSAEEVKMLYNLGASTKIAKTVNSQPDLENGLVGHWTFDGPDITGDDGVGIVDRSGQGNHGQLKGVATTSAVTPGRIGQALEFDGVNDYVEIADNSDIRNWPNGITVSVWAKSNTATWNSHGMLVSKRNSFILHPQKGGKQITFYFNNGTSWNSVLYTSTEDLTQWNNYIGVYDNNILKIYENGNLKNSMSLNSVIQSDSGILLIGKDDDFNDRYMNGSIDDVRIYNRALSAEEVQRLYNMGR